MYIVQYIGYYFYKYKYFWTLLLFAIIGGFIGNNSLWRYLELRSTNNNLREEIAEYDARIEEYRQQYKVLESDPSAVETIARVRLLMKKVDEDVYIVETAQGDTVNNN